MNTPLAAATLGTAAESHPVGIFFSYAREDSDIVDVFERAFQAISQLVRGNIKVFRDRSSIAAGGHITASIKNALEESDYLVVFYTGTLKKSHSWTGREIGFFEALIAMEGRNPVHRDRQIISIYFDEPPAGTEDIEGICLQIQPYDLSLPRDQYIAGLRLASGNAGPPDLLTRFLNGVARTAEQRLPDLRDAETVEGERSRRAELIRRDIVPQIKAAMYDCLGSRVARRSIEQRLIEFEIEAPALRQRSTSIPVDAKLRSLGNAFEIFNLAGREERISWGDFTRELSHIVRDDASAICRAIERVFDSAVSSISTVDNDQLIRSPRDGKLYRVLVTRHFDYYNGRKIVHMYFIEKLRRTELGNEDTSILLAFINVTARYRSIFLEAESDLSEAAFQFEVDPEQLQDKVHRILQEIVMIEDESAQLKLDGTKAATLLYGKDADLSVAAAVTQRWLTARAELFATAAKVLQARTDDPAFAAAINEWRGVLKHFSAVTREINSGIAALALKRLGMFFT